jgi:hypothetical protein
MFGDVLGVRVLCAALLVSKCEIDTLNLGVVPSHNFRILDHHVLKCTVANFLMLSVANLACRLLL